MTTYFISDLHLSAQRAEIIELLLRFLNDCHDADSLYILGDLFEVWIGDDFVDPALEPVINALKLFSRTSNCFIMHGNRDFLIGAEFESQTGCQLLADEVVIDLYGTKTLLLHGDTLCTDDHEYQAIRKQVRTEKWQSDVLALPVPRRLQMAQQVLADSKNSKSNKSEQIMDVNQQAVVDTMSKHGVDLLIHGHTHRLATHEFHIADKPVKRIVLGDWYNTSSILACDPNGQNFIS